MNIAWGSAALLLLIMPGFAALFGFYTGSRLNGQLRDVTPKSRAGELAMVMFLSLGCHLLLLLIFLALGGDPVYGIDTLAADANHCLDVGLVGGCRPSAYVFSHRAGILSAFGYVIGSSVLGYISGSLFIKLIEREWLPIKVRRFHAWTYDFVIPPRLSDEETCRAAVTDARGGCEVAERVRRAWRYLIHGPARANVLLTVLTKVTYDKGAWFVGYRGYLDQMHLDGDQNIKLVLLRNAHRVFFHLKSDTDIPPRFAAVDMLGALLTPSIVPDGPDVASLLIPADTIANIVRDVTIREFTPSPADISYLAETLNEIPAQP